jgi:hypothetical protein
MRIRIQQLKLMRIHADPDPKPCQGILIFLSPGLQERRPATGYVFSPQKRHPASQNNTVPVPTGTFPLNVVFYFVKSFLLTWSRINANFSTTLLTVHRYTTFQYLGVEKIIFGCVEF